MTRASSSRARAREITAAAAAVSNLYNFLPARETVYRLETRARERLHSLPPTECVTYYSRARDYDACSNTLTETHAHGQLFSFLSASPRGVLMLSLRAATSSFPQIHSLNKRANDRRVGSQFYDCRYTSFPTFLSLSFYTYSSHGRRYRVPYSARLESIPSPRTRDVYI